MYKKISRVKILLNPKVYRKLTSMDKSGYLYDIGWINSFNKQLPLDVKSKPLPWVTYSFIEFISTRLNSSMEIFEFGSGNSTLWYADKVKSIKEDGIIVLDDSDRELYQEAISYLLEKNFKKIDFLGIAPTIFYRNQNCIGI